MGVIVGPCLKSAEEQFSGHNNLEYCIGYIPALFVQVTVTNNMT